MSLILHLEQGTNELNRVLYVPNNIGEIIESHGCTWTETERSMLKDNPYMVHPFYMLPMGYDTIKDNEDRKFVYDCAMVELTHINDLHQYDDNWLE